MLDALARRVHRRRRLVLLAALAADPGRRRGRRAGRRVTAAAILFCIAIGAFVTSEMIFIKQLGLGTALAATIDATIVRALLVPSLMALLGDWNWWAPRPLARLHARIGLRESTA